MLRPDLDTVKRVMYRKGYRIFNGAKPYDLNIVGVRSLSERPDSFDDILLVFYSNTEGQQVYMTFPITSDPGLYYLKRPMNVNGTAIMMEGQYRGAYMLGRHKGYRALRQVAPIDFVRDHDRDGKLDFNGARTERGIIGANIHRASPTGSSERVGRWSAGCQVFKSYLDFEVFILICEKAARYWSDRFTYTLLNERDL